jgi:HEPN domain-containing protein
MPPEADDATFSAGVWLEYADEDLGAARSLLPLGYLRSACFHAQQATEKALNGLLAFLSEEDIPRTHDLNILVRLVTERGGGVVPDTGLQELQSYAVTARYPGPYEPSPEDAKQALTWASAMVSFVRSAVVPPDAVV